MIEQLRELVVEVLHTKEGSRVALQCIWRGTVKVYTLYIRTCMLLEVHVCIHVF